MTTALAGRSIRATRAPSRSSDLTVADVVVAGQREASAVPVLGVAGQADPVVGGVGLLGQHGDPPCAIGVASAHRLDEPVADHAVPDHHDVPGSC